MARFSGPPSADAIGRTAERAEARRRDHVQPEQRAFTHRQLSNPADVKRQMIGVFSRQWVKPLAHVLKNLGSERAFVVHGSDGLDEITTSGTTAASLEKGEVTTFEIAPDDVGLKRAKAEALRDGDADQNAKALMAVLKDQRSPFRDIAVLNAAAALVVAGKAAYIKSGIALPQKSIDSGEAEARLDRLIVVSGSLGLESAEK
jgi:anthranilate phosphoribosyltransferase